MADRRRQRNAGAGFAFRAIAFVLRPFLMSTTRRDWSGGEHIPPPGTGVVVAANHISHFDPLTFAHFLWDHGRVTRYLAKESVFRIPVVGRIVAAAGQIPVFRESRDASQAYRAAVDAVNAGELVAIYPEGTITRDPGMWPMVGKTGAARIALETGRDVVPVAQWGPHEVLAPYSKRPRLFPRKVMRVKAGPPVDLDDLRGVPLSTQIVRRGADRIDEAITAQLAAIRNEPAPQRRFDVRAAGLPPVGDPSVHRPADTPDGVESDGVGPDRAEPPRRAEPPSGEEIS